MKGLYNTFKHLIGDIRIYEKYDVS
jgi:hypothetical protein